MNKYMLEFIKLGEARDQALTMIAGLCLTFVLAYGLMKLYRRLRLTNDYFYHLGQFGIVSTCVLLYLCSWFVG